MVVRIFEKIDKKHDYPLGMNIFQGQYKIMKHFVESQPN